MFRLRPPITALACLLAGATLYSGAPLPELPTSVLQTLAAQESTRVAAATAYVSTTVLPTLGLLPTDTLEFRNAITNTQGECVVRFEQFRDQVFSDKTYHVRVADTGVVVKVAPDGTYSVSASKVLKPFPPATAAAPMLTPAQALEVLTTKLNPVAGYTRTPSLELVIFQSRESSDLALVKDPATGLLAANPLQGGEIFTPEAPAMPAYRIEAVLKAGDPTLPETRVVVVMDAQSGTILERHTAGPEVKNPFLYARGPAYVGQPTANAPAMLAAAAASTKSAQVSVAAATTSTWTPIDIPAGTPTQTLVPKLGRGLTEYMGIVDLPTTYDPVLNGYGLLDITRGGAANYFTQEFLGYQDSYGYYHPNTLRPAGNMVVSGQGLGMWTPYTMDGLVGSMKPYTGVASDLVTGMANSKAVNDFSNISLDNVWGNFQNLTPDLSDAAHDYGAYSTAGKTAAADAMNTMTCAYEFMKATFNRTGLDNHDSAMTITVNFPTFGPLIVYDTWFNRGFDPETLKADNVPIFLLRCGTGDPANGILNPAEPSLLGASISAMLYEYQLGNLTASSTRDYAAVAASFTNLMSQGIYSLGSLHGLNRRVILPTWGTGYNYANGSYLASFVKPSLDGISPDAYYDGESFVAGGEGFYSSGPLNRAYFFLSEGASTVEGSRTYSPYLPSGMTGIGLEKTCKIAYKAFTERYATPNLSVFELRDALKQAAADLYGAGSAEEQAVWNALAAVNIGAAYGKPEPVRVWMDMHNWPDGSDLGIYGPFEPNPRSQRYPWVPAGETAQLKVHVTGATDPTVIWTNNPAPNSWSGYFSLFNTSNGTITPEGLFSAPIRTQSGTIGYCSVQATSKEDPKVWSQGIVFTLSFDYDGDGANDALDLGVLALCVGVPYNVYHAINDSVMTGFPGISEGELQMNLAAFQTAFGK